MEEGSFPSGTKKARADRLRKRVLVAVQVFRALCGGEHNAVNARGIKKGLVPFLIRPITHAIAGKITSLFLAPNFKTHYTFLEDQLKTSPDGGEFLCGKDLTAADILMSFPLRDWAK